MQDSAPQQPQSTPPAADDTALDDFLGAGDFGDRLARGAEWLGLQLSSVNVSIQAAIIAVSLIPAAIFGSQIRKLIIAQIAPRAPYGVLRRAANAFAHIALPIALYLIWLAASVILDALGRPNGVLDAAISLLLAWIVIRLVTLVIRSPFWSRVAFYIAWPVAALDAFGLLDDTIRALDTLSVPLGRNADGTPGSFSAFDFIRVIILLLVLFWIASALSRFLKARIAQSTDLTPSFQTLLVKILDIVLPATAFLVALQMVGFNFATLAIFGGAMGLAIGFGMQKTVSNFFAGFTLVAEKSIKPGDVVEVGQTFGWVTEMTARYVTIRTRDGKAHLIPNDRFIDEGVINWSHADRIVRLHAQFGVAYTTADLRAVKKAAEETAISVERVLKTPGPMCNLVEFGDSRVTFDLRFWINDPTNGVANVTSQVMLALWDRLKEMGVDMPYPQRDLHIRSMPQGFPTQS
ncbi:MAG: mechanosensitive ion channel [Parvularculaceae bacterium]|nr:mechanosensitive ion channel [Parvularculaceae bacterium]